MKYYFIFVPFFFLSCIDDKTAVIKNTAVQYQDSVLTLKGGRILSSNIDSLSARKVLYDHFRNKGVLIESELDLGTFQREAPENYGRKAVDFVKLYDNPIDRSGSKILSYYYCEPFINGHCVEPHFAIISNTKQGYKIRHEDFLPPKFRIDSVSQNHIYAYDYECANHKKRKSYRIIINQSLP